VSNSADGQRTHVSFVLIPRFSMLTLSAVIEPMRIANYLAPDPLYSWDYRSPHPGMVPASNGMEVHCGALGKSQTGRPDIVAVCGSWGAERYNNSALLNWLRRFEREGGCLISIELGIYVLARAGLLGGRRVTTHWSWKPGFAEQFPKIDICEQLYTIDRNVMTCAGGAAGLDLMLHLVGERHGEQLAMEVANQILYYPRRPAESAQRFVAGGLGEDLHRDVRAAMSLIELHIEEPIPVPNLCRQLGVSQRQLERLFRRSTGCTIVQFSKLLRLQYARVLLTSTRMTIREVSTACGFNSMSYFSLSFMKTFAKKPSEYRQAWPDNEPAPSWPGTLYSFIQQSGEENRPDV